MKRSSGILVYKENDNNYCVFLAHMGGPYWENIDEGAWSIPKGEYKKKESAIDCAKREFEEETGQIINQSLQYLCSKKVSKHKIVNMFTTQQELDIHNFKSNTFTIEFPKGSGKKETFPEMNKVEWFSIKDAEKVIIPNQKHFINRFKKYIEEIKK